MNCVWFECPNTAETGHRAGEGGRIARGVRDLKSADAGGEEGHIGGAPDSTSTIPSPILTPPPLTTPAMSIRLEAVLANSKPELITTPSMVAVPPASAVISPPEEMIALPPPLIVTSIAVPPLRTTILPPLPTMPPPSVPPERNSVLPLSITVPMARPRPKTMKPPPVAAVYQGGIGDAARADDQQPPARHSGGVCNAAGNRNLLATRAGRITAFKQARYR